MNKKSFLKHSVLVINKGWQPVNVTIVEDAVGLILKGIADFVVHNDVDDKFKRRVANKFELLDYERWIMVSENLSESKHKVIHSVKNKYLLPNIISLRKFGGHPKYHINLTKTAIFNRDKGTCQYCREVVGRDVGEIDHIFPKSKGGKSSWDNLVWTCHSCNTRKRDKTIAEMGYKLIRKPVKPTAINFSDIYKKEFSVWKDFIGKDENTNNSN